MNFTVACLLAFVSVLPHNLRAQSPSSTSRLDRIDKQPTHTKQIRFAGTWVRVQELDRRLGFLKDRDSNLKIVPQDSIEIVLDKSPTKDVSKEIAEAQDFLKTQNQSYAAIGTFKNGGKGSRCFIAYGGGKTYLWRGVNNVGVLPVRISFVRGAAKSKDLLFLDFDPVRDFHRKNRRSVRVTAYRRATKSGEDVAPPGGQRFQPDSTALKRYFESAFSPGGKRIGIRVSPADSALRKHVPATQGKYGLVVTDVIKDGPAAEAGVQTLDVILSANGKLLANEKQLGSAVQAAGEKLSLSILRSGKPKTISIPLPASSAPKESKYIIGVNPVPADATLIKQLELPPATGLVIAWVTPKGPAANAGLQPHDVIFRVEKTDIRKPADLGRELDKRNGQPVTIEFVRGGRKQTCRITPQKRTDRQKALIEQGNRVLWYMKSATHRLDIEMQLNRLSKQIQELQKSFEALKKSIAAGERERERKK